jgi:hypothetical protein
MFSSLLLLAACAPRPLEGYYGYEVLADENFCGYSEQPDIGLGEPVLDWRVDNVTDEQFELTLGGFHNDSTVPCSFSGRHFSCVVEPIEFEEGWTINIAAGGAWLSEDEASLYWGMFQDCDWGGSRCTREYTCSIFAQFRITLNGIEQ